MNTITVTFKTPDTVDAAIGQYIENAEVSDEDMEYEMKEKAEEVINKYVRWGECITIEFDLITGKATVLNA